MEFDAETSDFKWLLFKFTEIIDIFVLVIFAITMAVVVWQIINAWVIRGGDEYALKDAKKTVFIGFIVLIIMSAVWGIVALLQTAIQ